MHGMEVSRASKGAQDRFSFAAPNLTNCNSPNPNPRSQAPKLSKGSASRARAGIRLSASPWQRKSNEGLDWICRAPELQKQRLYRNFDRGLDGALQLFVGLNAGLLLRGLTISLCRVFLRGVL